MKRYDVQSVELRVAPERAFEFIADARQLPRWTDAFADVRGQHATLRTATGETEIELIVAADAKARTVDWRMRFPGGVEAEAYSRIVSLGPDRCVYTFVLTPPPVPLEQLEGALEAQSRTLAAELTRLKQFLEGRE